MKRKRRVMDILGIIVGLITAIFGITQMNEGNYIMTVESIKYGGDAYTGIQNAGAVTANNIKMLIEVMEKYFSTFFVILGIFLIIHFFRLLMTDGEDTNTPINIQTSVDNKQIELEKLNRIREKGILTEEEYEHEKEKINR